MKHIKTPVTFVADPHAAPLYDQDGEFIGSASFVGSSSATSIAREFVQAVNALGNVSYDGPVAVCSLDGKMEDCEPFDHIQDAIELARANALQDRMAYAVWTEDDELIIVVPHTGDVFVKAG